MARERSNPDGASQETRGGGSGGTGTVPPRLPDQLHGVPESLRTWWERVDPKDLEKASLSSGRADVFAHLTRLLHDKGSASAAAGSRGRVLDLGCGCGLLAKESARRDIVGVDMSPAMVCAAGKFMDVVVLDSFLEYYPSENFDTVVLCNVLESYPEEMRSLVFKHAMDYISPGGQVIVVVSAGSGGGLCCEGESGLHLLFPTISGELVRPDEIEEGLMLAGFDLKSTELIETRTLHTAGALPGEAPKSERRAYAVIVGRKPIVMGGGAAFA